MRIAFLITQVHDVGGAQIHVRDLARSLATMGHEPFVLTGGGPGNSTTLLSIDLVKMALGQFDLGPAAAMSLIYFAITLGVSWLFYTLMTKDDLN